MAAATADWLESVYRPPTPTVLGEGTPDDVELEVQHARRISAELRKKAQRRRQREDFLCPIDRRTARWLGHLWDAALLLGGIGLLADNEAGFITIPPDVQRTLQSFRFASRTARGRPRLSLDEMEDQEMDRTHRGSADDGGRHKRRIAREAIYERALRKWIADGNSALGSTDTLPKK
jgi:hypothetical protein